MSPLPSPRSPGSVLLHRRYSVELHPDSVLSRDGLTCWVLIATDTAFDRRRVAIKMYKVDPEFTSDLILKLMRYTSARLLINKNV